MASFSQRGIEGNLDFELRHKAIIDRFGHYPHRNAFLGRTSTAQELAFLSEPGSVLNLAWGCYVFCSCLRTFYVRYSSISPSTPP